MAEKIDHFPDERAPAIPWHDYADGDRYLFTRYKDFQQEPSQARRAAIQWGWRHGYTVNSGFDDEAGEVWFRFTRKEPT